MGCLYVLALEVGSLVGLSACGACPGGWSPAQRAPFQGRVGRHGGESVAAGSDSRVPLGAGAPPTRRLRGPTRRVARCHWERRASPLGPLALPVDVATSQWEGEWDFQTATRKASGSTGARLPRPTGSLAGDEAPSPGPTRQREAPSACAHWEAAPLPCARHFLWGTFLLLVVLNAAAPTKCLLLEIVIIRVANTPGTKDVIQVPKCPQLPPRHSPHLASLAAALCHG